MFETLIVQPIFNLLVLIYALIPGHNFGLAIILFTVIIRLLLWPLIKRQLHQTKLMRRHQPELRRIARETKGDKQKQMLMQMELYKEKGIRPGVTLLVALVQLPIFFALYAGLRRVIKDPHELINFAYPAVHHLPWMEQLSRNIKQFDSSLFGVIDLHRAAAGPAGLYVPALVVVLASVVVQYFQTRQLMPQDKEARSLRAILRDAGAGKQADQQEISAAVGRFTILILPVSIFVITVSLASALSLYWLTSGLVALVQQTIVLREDGDEMERLAGAPAGPPKDAAGIPEAETVETRTVETGAHTNATPKPNKKKSSKKAKKRRRK